MSAAVSDAGTMTDATNFFDTQRNLGMELLRGYDRWLARKGEDPLAATEEIEHVLRTSDVHGAAVFYAFTELTRRAEDA